MTLTPQDILEAVKNVKDPELGRPLLELGMLRNIQVSEGNKVSLTVVLTTPACPLKDSIKQDIAKNLQALPISSLDVRWDAQVSGRQGTVAEKKRFPNIKNIIAVGSGKGGVGKSMCALNLAISLAHTGARVGLLDADVYGPSIPKMVGHVEHPDILDGKKLAPVERFGLKLMSFGFLIRQDEPVVWRGPMLHGVLNQFFTDVAWGELDYLLVDMPPGTGDIQLTLSAGYELTGAVIVTTPQEVAHLIAYKGLRMFQKMGVTILGLIENMSFMTCSHCAGKLYPFGQGKTQALAGEWKVPFLGEIPLWPELSASHDLGVPGATLESFAGQFIGIASRLAAQISMANFDASLNQPGHTRSF
jgi:ATP-binding protein involved in chromosome partitioning